MNTYMKEWTVDKSTFIYRIGTSKLLGTILLWLGIFHLLVQLAIVMPREMTRTDRTRDVEIYYQAALHAYNQHSIYQILPNHGPDRGPREYGYFYLPPCAALLGIFGGLSVTAFYKLWLCFMLLAFWLFAYALARIFNAGGEASIKEVLIWGLVAGLFPGTYNGIGIGNIDPLLWAYYGIGFLGVYASTFWVISAIIKPLFIWSYLAQMIDIYRRNDTKLLLRSLILSIIVTICLFLYGGIVCGWDSYLFWLHHILPTLSQGDFNPENVSLSFAFIRLALVLGWHYPGGPLAALPHLWLTATAIGAPLLTWILARNYPERLKYASILATSILFAPICWLHYLPLILPLIAILLQIHVREKIPRSSNDLLRTN